MLYYSLLDAELDDWIDPSLPSMFTLSQRTAFIFSDEFTDANDEFRRTTLLPTWSPVMTSEGIWLK
jgi:hypothetical protein